MLKQPQKKFSQYESVYLKHDLHLGDTIIALLGLHNRFLHTQKPIKLYGRPVVLELLEIFNFKGINYQSFISKSPNRMIKHLLPRKQTQHFRTYFLNFFCLYSDNFPIYYNLPWSYPETKIIKKESSFDKTYFQFDTRNSFHKDTKKLNEPFITYFLAKYCKNKNIYGIGGPDTKTYLEYPFNVGKLKDICGFLLGAKNFIGVDSGISHLACLLKIKTTLINLHTTQKSNREIKLMYQMLYPETDINFVNIKDLSKNLEDEHFFRI